MELSQAISQAIKEFGKDILAEKRIINVLKDYNAFSATTQCDIMIAIVEDGKLYDLLKQTGFVTTGILQFSFYSTEKKKKKLTDGISIIINEISHIKQYQENYVLHVLQQVLIGYGVPSDLYSKSIRVNLAVMPSSTSTSNVKQNTKKVNVDVSALSYKFCLFISALSLSISFCFPLTAIRQPRSGFVGGFILLELLCNFFILFYSFVLLLKRGYVQCDIISVQGFIQKRRNIFYILQTFNTIILASVLCIVFAGCSEIYSDCFENLFNQYTHIHNLEVWEGAIILLTELLCYFGFTRKLYLLIRDDINEVTNSLGLPPIKPIVSLKKLRLLGLLFLPHVLIFLFGYVQHTNYVRQQIEYADSITNDLHQNSLKVVDLSFKELRLGDSFEKCLKDAVDKNLIDTVWRKSSKTPNIYTSILDNRVSIHVDCYHDTIYSIEFSTGSSSYEELKEMYIKKYGEKGIVTDVRSEDTYQFRNKDTYYLLTHDTPSIHTIYWSFKNGSITIDEKHGTVNYIDSTYYKRYQSEQDRLEQLRQDSIKREEQRKERIEQEIRNREERERLQRRSKELNDI